MVKGVSADVKWMRKRWYDIEAPDLFKNEFLGQTPADNDKKVIGRIVETNGLLLMGDPKKQNRKLFFKIEDVKGGVAKTRFYSYEILSHDMRRIIRRGGSNIYVRQQMQTKDNKKFIIKVIGFTATRCEAKKRAQLRNKMTEELTKTISELTLDDVIMQVMFSKIQPNLKKILNTIQPIKFIEVTKIENVK